LECAMNLRELSELIASGIRGAVLPTRVWIPYSDWCALRSASGYWADQAIAYPHFLWKGIPITYFEGSVR